MSGFDILFAAAGNLYLLLALAAICFALWIGKTWMRKLVYAVLALALFIAPIAPEIYRTIEYRGKLAKAQALFDERCKTAGEKIYKTVEGVDGLLIMKARPEKINLSDQYALDDPYGRDFGGEEYVASFLWGRNSNGTFTQSHKLNTYKFVELEDSSQKVISRYEANQMFSPAGVPYLKLKAEIVGIRSAKYGVTWADSSTKEDRDQWIAGSLLRVVDLTSGEVIAERVGFMFDRALGDQSGGRSPWTYAEYQACPAYEKSANGYPIKSTRSREFIFKSLKPIKGE